MKNNRYLSLYGVAFFLLTVGLALFSWMGSIYGTGEVQSLLSAEGVRWLLGHAVENYVQDPAFGGVFVLMMGWGVMARSGIFDALYRYFRQGKQLSRKERRALVSFAITFLFYVLLVSVVMILPWNLLLSATGSWLNSPFSKGFVYLLSLGLGLGGMAYGYVADVFRGAGDIVEAMSHTIARNALFFVVLFFVVQFFTSLEYTRLLEWLGVTGFFVDWIYLFCSYFPLLLLGQERE